MVDDEDRIQFFNYNNKDGDSVPLYQRYIGEETECWFFGSGLGEYTMFQQMGDSFLQLVDRGEDPELGRIMFSMGHGESAFMSYKGDYNVVWIWALKINELRNYINKLACKPDLFMSNDPVLNHEAHKYGLESLRICSGVNPRFFHPLDIKRRGIGYCGVDNKGKHQYEVMIEPAMKYNFEWISRFQDELLTIPQLNEWYNSKQIVLGMVHETRQNISYLPTRVVETLATGTPFITYELHNLKDSLGFEYPWQSSSAEETTEIIESMLEDYDNTLNLFRKYAKTVTEIHDYKKKMRQIFSKLEDI